MKNNIILSHEGTPNGPSPKSLRHFGTGRILQRTIVQLSQRMGSYGMGGPGFWGFKLNKTDIYPDEWLILSLWAASYWLLFDGQIAEVVPTEETLTLSSDTGLPKIYQLQETRTIELIKIIVGSKIIAAHINDISSSFELKNGAKIHRMEISKNTSPYQEPLLRAWNPEESHWDAWVISETGQLWV